MSKKNAVPADPPEVLELFGIIAEFYANARRFEDIIVRCVSAKSARVPFAAGAGPLVDWPQQVTYLKTENKILRCTLPDRIHLNNQDRGRLVKHGKKLGARINDLISVASLWLRNLLTLSFVGNQVSWRLS